MIFDDDYYAGPGDEGLGVIEWAIDNDIMDRDDEYAIPEYVTEIPKEEFCRAVGHSNEDICYDTINESEEDDFEWVSKIEPDTNLEIGQLFYKYDVDKDTEPFFIHDLNGKFDDITFKDGRVLMHVDSQCELVDLFVDNDSSQYGYITRWLAEKVLCDEDYWEPYDNVVYDWMDQVWEPTTKDEKLFNHIINYIKENFLDGDHYMWYDGDETLLDERYLNHLINEDLLGDAIRTDDIFDDIKSELTWAYTNGYNIAARDEIWNSTKSGINDHFGEGKWESYVVRKMDGEATRHALIYDVTDVFWGTLRDYFDYCWDDCKRYYQGDYEAEADDFMDWCDDCWDLPFGDFFTLYKDELSKKDELSNPSFDEYPDDDKTFEYFKEDVFERI
jgi:hypothetical protein